MRQLPVLLSSAQQPADAETTLATRDGRTLAWAACSDEAIWCAGQTRRARILRHVALAPHRSTAEIVPLMQQALATGAPAMILAPAAAAAAPWGFWQFANGCRLAFPPGRPTLHAAPGLRPVLAADRPGLQRLYDGYASRLVGPGPWQTDMWRQIRLEPDDSWMAYEQDGELTGVIGITFQRQPGHLRARVVAIIDETPEAFAALMGYVGHLVDEGIDVRVEALPDDRPALAVGDVISKQRASLERTMAVRPGDPGVWLSALRYGSGAGDIALAVDDPLGIWPPALHLRWRDGTLQDWQTTGARPDATLHLPALMALATRQLSAEQLVFLGWLNAPRSWYNRLENLWERHVLHRFVWERV
jgi:hypothetical protein